MENLEHRASVIKLAKKVPEGAEIKTGKNGGKYYETKSGTKVYVKGDGGTDESKTLTPDEQKRKDRNDKIAKKIQEEKKSVGWEPGKLVVVKDNSRRSGATSYYFPDGSMMHQYAEGPVPDRIIKNGGLMKGANDYLISIGEKPMETQLPKDWKP